MTTKYLEDNSDYSDFSEVLPNKGPFFEPNRFNVMISLYQSKKIAFTSLQQLLGLTPGNLDHHIRKLSEQDYVRTHKIITWRPLTMVEITSKGLEAFREHVKKLRLILLRIT
ncbi:MAG: transcriptional regulator [Candidatus Hodarchaeota archaeon]